MATAKEIFLQLLKQDGKPERQLKQYEALGLVLADPINAYLRQGIAPMATVKNRWGVTITFPPNAPGPMPHITEENKVCPDITRWKEFVHAPDLAANCRQGWDICEKAVAQVDRNEQLVTAFMGTGIFEQCHFLMGFEDTLTALYEHPDEMHQLIAYIAEFKMQHLAMLIEKMQPDAILAHDDWGAKDALFMAPDMWRKFFKEPYRRFYGYMREKGVIAIHHGDSYLADIVEDMVEIGVQCWQGVLPENDIPSLQKKLAGRMILMGGIGAAIDRQDTKEEEIRRYVSGVLAENCPGGHFIPCITYGLPGTVYKQVDPIITDEIEQYNLRPHLPAFYQEEPERRRAQRTTQACAAKKQEGRQEKGVLAELAAALQKGQKKKVLALVEDALAQDIDAQSIITDGLVQGMAQLGEAFSAGRAFVPEMLVAARCMTAATERLKPLLAGSGTKTKGKVCLGTVKGDQHDIGKNLVKIMMEGAGLEVVDLGVDVAAEQFVATAKDQNCQVIALSAMLTTTMAQMEQVVELAGKAGIRGEVKIMVGGAPIDQDYCTKIGADAYTLDAAQAAVKAAELAQKR